MTVQVPRLPFSLDPLIAEAKRRTRRRRGLILSVLLVAIATAAAALELRPASGSGLAATGGKPVIHIVMQWPPSTVYFDLKTGHRIVKTLGEEMWSDVRPNGWHHIISTEGGRRVADQLWRARYGSATEAAAVDRFYRSLVIDYRAALRTGRVKLVGRGTFEGHHVDWLGVVRRRDEHWYVLRQLGEVGVDGHTHKPILVRSHSGKRYVYERILLAQAIAYNAADFKRGGPRQIPGFPGQLAPGYAFGSTNPSAQRHAFVHAPWLTAGAEVAGLKLRAVTPFTIRKTKHRFDYGAPRPKPIHGLALVYGPATLGTAPTLPTPVNVYGRPRDARAATRFTVVYELPRAPRTLPWFRVPSGSVEVQNDYTTVGTHVVPTAWIGYLREHGLYITISTPRGERTPLQIARSLRAAAK